MNAKMPDLVRAFEAAGFDAVSTVLGSGNVIFTAAKGSASTLERRAERAMESELGRSFLTFARPIDALRGLLDSDPYAAHALRPGSKRVVTFLREPCPSSLEVPWEKDGTRILRVTATEVLSAYVPDPRVGGLFMRVLEQACGKDQTTRTWETIEKVVKRGEG